MNRYILLALMRSVEGLQSGCCIVSLIFIPRILKLVVQLLLAEFHYPLSFVCWFFPGCFLDRTHPEGKAGSSALVGYFLIVEIRPEMY